MIQTSPATRETLMSMSGLAFLEAILDGQIPAASIGPTMGFHLSHVAQGSATFEGSPHDHVTNPMGTVHGGWYGTILDSAMGCAVMTTLPAGALYTTLEYKVNIIKPIPLGTVVLASAHVQHAGRSTAIANGELRGKDDEKLYATASTTCIIMKG